MEPAKQIETFKEFFDERYELELLEAITTDKGFFVVDFPKVAEYSPDLASDLLEDPENVIRTAFIAAQQIATKHQGSERLFDIEVRFRDLPGSSRIPVGTLRSKELRKLIQVRGIVRQKSDVRPQVVSSKFECPACGAIIPVLQVDMKFKEPTRCQCGRKGQFREISKQLVDAQKIVLEEASDELDGSEQPKRLNIILKKDLVSPLSDRRSNPGSKIEVVGYLTEVPVQLPQGQGRSTRYDIMMEGNWVEPVEEEFGQITISPEEVERIKSMAADPENYKKLVTSVAPSIYGHDKVKEALVLQLLGGVKKIRPDGVSTRGDMHVLLIGDPGSGKCVTGETLVQLGDGTIAPIQEVFAQQRGTPKGATAFDTNTPFTVASVEGHGHAQNEPVTTVWCRVEEKPLLRITLASGDVLTVTEDHPLFTTHEAYALAVPASDLTESMPIMTARIVRPKTAVQTLPQAIPSGAQRPVPLRTPSIVDEELARWLGYLCGDGWIQKRASGQPPSMLSFTNADEEVLYDYRRCVERCFGITPGERDRDGSRELYTTSSSLHAWLATVAPELVATADRKTVPDIVAQSHLGVVAAFLQALFECDAHVTEHARTVQYSTKSPRLAREVRMLLLRFGIRSQLLTKRKHATNTVEKTVRTYYEVHITGSDVDTYGELIGFTSTRKRSACTTHVSKKNTNKDVLPSVAGTLRELRRRYGKRTDELGIPEGSYKHYEKGDRRPTREQLKRIIANYPSDDELAHRLKVFADAEVFWDTVRTIERLPGTPTPVYDFEVGRTHTFVAECAVIHNSQMIRRMTKVAPKARFVSGKGSSAAGLTASVVKDEFLRGYALEAGALVLANKGFAMIDELDKMSPEDRSAFHEALEQQCYHYDTELTLADGSVAKIGAVVERLLAENRDEVIRGKDCEILPLPGINLMTTDFEGIFPVEATTVSRHVAPPEFVRIGYSNGRSITVTPEHPVFTYQDGVATTRADAVRVGMLAPAPRRTRKTGSGTAITPEMGALLGYIASEGHSYIHPRGTYAEIGVSNTDPAIIEEVQGLFEEVFRERVNLNTRPIGGKAQLELVTVRTSSVPLYRRFAEAFPELAKKAPQKRVGNLLRTAPDEAIREFLRTAFHGDGFVTSTRLGYATASYGLAKDYQDLLLLQGVYAYIRSERREEKTYYKVVVSGATSLERFVPIVAIDRRIDRILALHETASRRNNDRDIIPHALVRRLDSLLRRYRVSDGYFHRIIARGQNAHRETVARYLERLEGKATPEELAELTSVLHGDLGFVTVTSVERVANTDQAWVYDVQVEPTHAFVSEGLVLHNTVTISKANIQATLRCETVVLAAANPKYGRFDPYELLAKQIDLPSTLINRFDLIFPIKDMPSKQRDEEMAHFILTMHQTRGEVEVAYTTEEIKKFIAYARQHCIPTLSEEALEEIKKFYVDLRNSSKDQEMASIPISARQLEGLVRLSEASARSRLSPVIRRDDAKKAIELVYYCLSQIGIDPQTGKLDIDRASGNVPASERNVIHQIRDIIKELGEQTGQSLVPEEDIIAEAKNRGIQSQKADDAIQKLNQKGDIYQPRPGFYSMMK